MSDAAAHAPSPADPALRRNLRLLPWWWVIRFAWFGEGIWVLYLVEERGLSLDRIFLFEAIYAGVVIAAEVPTGIVADRWGRRLSLLLGSMLFGVAVLALGTSHGFLLLLTTYALLAGGEAFMSGADSALLFDSLRGLGEDHRFAAMMGRLNALVTGAIAGFTLIGGLMVRWLPLSAPIVLSAVAMLPAIALAFLLRDPPLAGERLGFVASGRSAWRRVRTTRAIWGALTLWGLSVVTVMTMAVGQQPVIRGYGVPLWTLGIFVAAQMLAATLGSLVAGPLRRRLGVRGAVALAAIGGPLGLALGALGHPAAFPLLVLPAFSVSVLEVIVIDFVARRVPDRERATVTSIGSMLGSAGAIVAGLTLAAVTGRAGLESALVLGGGALAAASALVFIAWRPHAVEA